MKRGALWSLALDVEAVLALLCNIQNASRVLPLERYAPMPIGNRLERAFTFAATALAANPDVNGAAANGHSHCATIGKPSICAVVHGEGGCAKKQDAESQRHRTKKHKTHHP